MTREPVTLGPEESLMRALEVMRRNAIRRIPVVLGDELLGLLAEGDLKRAQPSALSASEEEFHRVMEGITVSRIMIERPVTVDESTPLIEAARTLHTTKFGALPVLNGGKLVGILTDSDLARCLVELLEEGG
jgi:acetoin utilization protein AcuB